MISMYDALLSISLPFSRFSSSTFIPCSVRSPLLRGNSATLGNTMASSARASPITMISTRRFSARPSFVSLEAIGWLEKAGELSGGSSYPLAYLGWAYGLANRTDDALLVLATLTERAKTGTVPEFAFVVVHIGLGQLDEAFAWIEQAYQARSNYMLWLGLRTFSRGLSGDPRYAAWIEKMDLRIFDDLPIQQ